MEITKKNVVDLVVGITGLEKEFVNNSLDDDSGATIVTNQFKEKSRVFNKEDFDLREANILKGANDKYLVELVGQAKEQKLPAQLYNAVATNIISSGNKKLAKEFGIELDDYSDVNAITTAVKEKLSKVDNETVLNDLQETQKALKDFTVKFEDQEKRHKLELKNNNINIVYSEVLNDFPIDYETDEELTNRREVADSVFKSRYTIDVEDGKEVVKDSKGEIIKDETTKEPVSIQHIFDTEISKFVPLKKERSKGRKPGDPKENVEMGSIKTLADFDKQMEKEDIKSHSVEYVKRLNELKKTNDIVI